MTSIKRKTAKTATAKTVSRAAANHKAANTRVSRKPGKRTRRPGNNDNHNAGKAGVMSTAGGRQSKQAAILGLLRRPEGASIEDLTSATGWQVHSVRAALTGLRKKGHEIVRTKDDTDVTRYRIAGEA